MIVIMVKTVAEKTSMLIVSHLNHGTGYFQNILCHRAGFTLLIYDGSALLFEEKVAMTKKVVEMVNDL